MSSPDRPDLAPGDQAPPELPGAGPNICPHCGGSGERDGKSCPHCGGTGEVTEAIGGG